MQFYRHIHPFCEHIRAENVQFRSPRLRNRLRFCTFRDKKYDKGSDPLSCFRIEHCRRSDRSMFSLCSVPSACLQNAISSSAKTARPRRGALNSTYWFPVLRLPGSRRALGLAKQGLKSHCKRRSGQSRFRENMDLPLLKVWLFAAYSLHLCCIAYNINMTGGLTLCHICLHKFPPTQQLPPYVLTERHLWSRGSLPISGAALRGGSASSREAAVVGKPNK